MKIVVYRHTYNTTGDRNIIGDLFIDGVFFCHTLEDEKRADGVKVYGKTAIPAMEYDIKITYSPRFKRNMPLLLDVPMFKGIRIHGGNDSTNTLGCILVAFKTDLKRIWSTAEKTLTQKLQQSENKITIEIKDAFLSYNKELKQLNK
tara:strand:+ start:1392 stop:1832 length:441 start_codon:yes stop_codon:yes gene_type:complete